jgi:hypothetical protein
MKSLRADKINLRIGPTSGTQGFDISPDDFTIGVHFRAAADRFVSTDVDSLLPETANQK